MSSSTEPAAAPQVALKRPLSRRKKASFSILIMIGVWCAVEGISLVGLHTTSASFRWGDLIDEQVAVARGAPTADESQETIHPYHGWAFNPQVSEGVDFAGRRIPVNALGLVDDVPAIQKRDPKKIIVGMTGGSVAWQMSVAGESAFKAELAQELGRAADEIILVRFGLSGFKQPQQLMTLNWLMTQGAEFDVVVNLDGYNEAVGAIDNRQAKVCMGYPVFWHARTRDIVDPREYSYSMELFLLRGQRQQVAQAALTSIWRWSPTYNFIWVLRDQQFRKRRFELSRLLIADHSTVGVRGFASSGPAEDFKDAAEADRLAVQIWSNSSAQMASLCRGARCQYLHCLQPNQYVPDSKVFSPLEREKYVRETLDHALIVKRLYPQFMQRGKELGQHGVRFRDLTMVFSQTTETVYCDGWCHFNESGSQIIAKEIAREVAAMLREKSAE